MSEPRPNESRLTHVDETGAARMVDVADKAVTARTATARGRVTTTPEVVALLRGAGVPKGDALGVARLAGILGAKKVPDLIPLCHPIALAGVTVELTVADDGVDITAVTKTADRTGVEMEAITAVAVAGLALHDMIKAVDPAAVLTDVRVMEKTGGKTGLWRRDDARVSTPAPTPAPTVPSGARAVVVAVSDRAFAGTYPDRGGPLLAGLLTELGFAVGDVVLVPDDVEAIVDALRTAVAEGIDLVVTTGGTGFSPRDNTPEATRQVLERDAAGLVETLRAADRDRVPTSVLSRGVAGTAGRTIVVNLPGSTGGVRDGVRVLAPVIGHAVAQVHGGGDHG
ncbi:MAG: cyclic pyranopterin monophosphate synthase [Frankiaceae bacterium]|nr:cyclic pyranopterin monophosphate synthase [Frankiaceae bacterium]MDQ1673512.1 cyclic pyranopterin monophosphate synthase [Frankiaceae bacterium]